MNKESIYRNGPMPLFILLVALILQNLPVNGQVLTLDPAVRYGKLSNGFTYYIRANQEPRHRVVMYLANKVGSMQETEDQLGLAHFMEHMSFNGTRNFPKGELVSYLQKAGVRFGADLNAYTSYDETVYQLPLPSDKPEILRNGIQIMRDWAQAATLSTEEINKERGVIMEEKRLGKGASERMQRKTMPLLLNQSRYASRLPIGTDKVLLNFKPETLRRFYRDWYRPNLQALIVVGDIDVAQIEREIKAKFSDLRNPENERKRVKYEIPLNGKNQFLAVTDKEMTSTVAQVLIKHKSRDLKTESDYRSSLVRGLFNQILNERYTELSRQAAPPFIQGSAGIQSILAGVDAYSVSVVAKPGELENGFKTVWRESRRVQLYGFDTTELDRAKQAYLSLVESMAKEIDKSPSDAYVKEYLENFLRGTAVPGIKKEQELMTRLLSGITLQEVNAVCKEYIKDTNRDIFLMAPEKNKAALPGEKVVLGWIQSVEQEKLQPFKDNISTLPLLSKMPASGKIVKEEHNTKLGLTTLTLSNGVKVSLKKTTFKNNQILFQGFSEGGTSLYNDADFQSAANAASIIASSGMGNYNASQLDKYLSGKQISVGPYIADRTQGFSGSASPSDLELALQLIYGYCTEPRKDEENFKNIISRSKNGLVNRLDDPNTVFSDTVSAVLSNYNVRYTAPSIDKINQVNLDRVFEIFKERFSNVSDLNFTFVGSIDEEKIKPLLEKYLGGLPSTGKKEDAKDLGVHIPEGMISKTVYKGSEQKSTVYLVYSGLFDYIYENRIKLDALKEVLEIRMLERLREEESGVYSPSVQVNASKYPDSRISLVISFGCAPKNVDRLIASAMDELELLKKNGPAQTNLDKYKAEALLQHESTIATNGYWLNYISGQEITHEPLDQVFGYNDFIKQLTTAGVRELADKYITGKNLIKFILRPEE